mmetsp:Transcript_18226/g.61460  ORF Transcript_18226/g.61460 Transcript_18226/m.61460 type:complete len:225 (+) Transcript_18226:1030-1704(+)
MATKGRFASPERSRAATVASHRSRGPSTRGASRRSSALPSDGAPGASVRAASWMTTSTRPLSRAPASNARNAEAAAAAASVASTSPHDGIASVSAITGMGSTLQSKAPGALRASNKSTGTPPSAVSLARCCSSFERDPTNVTSHTAPHSKSAACNPETSVFVDAKSLECFATCSGAENSVRTTTALGLLFTTLEIAVAASRSRRFAARFVRFEAPKTTSFADSS